MKKKKNMKIIIDETEKKIKYFIFDSSTGFCSKRVWNSAPMKLCMRAALKHWKLTKNFDQNEMK